MSTCRALLVSAPASGQGKTTATAALARRAVQSGLRVRVFKTGPDFLDPMILSAASLAPVYQLDLWMLGEAECRRRLALAAAEADLILIEGVMGLFDGKPSSADLAETFDLPVLALIDGSAMAQTFGAPALGLSQYRPTLHLHGVIANRVGSPGHRDMLANSLPDGLHFMGALPRDEQLSLPERHLGIVQAAELDDLDARLDAAANALGEAVPFDSIPSTDFGDAVAETCPPRLAGVRIGIARDASYAFVYPANLDVLRELGAELIFFSPLTQGALPECDALWLPGGYPELHAVTLSANQAMRAALHAHHAAGKPLLAECGGLISLFESLQDRDGIEHAMFGLLPGRCWMQTRFAALGMQAWDHPLGELRGHSFHYSACETPLVPIANARNPNGGACREAIYQQGRLTASYVHFYFASNPLATAALFEP